MNSGAEWQVPRIDNDNPLILEIKQGEVVLFVGPNGAGKSALNYWMYTNSSSSKTKRLLGHRQIWLKSSGPEVTRSDYQNTKSSVEHMNRQRVSRIQDFRGDDRTIGLLFDLAAKVNGRNSRIADLADSGRITERKEPLEPSPLAQIDEIFRHSGMDCKFSINDHFEFVVTRSTKTYPIAEMSDGEKSALILAAEVVLSDPGTVLLIDEPERHLHRAVSPDFIRALAASRIDVSIVLFTHDIELLDAMTAENAQAYYVRSVNWSSGDPKAWDIVSLAELPDSTEPLRRALLGGRTRLMMVEGDGRSLDKPLYESLFPTWTIVPSGGSDQVIRAVAGLNEQRSFHWIEAVGVIDGDCMGDEAREVYEKKNIKVLPFNEVESIYYLPEIAERVSENQGATFGCDPETLLSAARDEALKSIKNEQSLMNLAKDNSIKIIRRSIFERIPKKTSLGTDKDLTITIDSPVLSEFDLAEKLVAEGDHNAIVNRFSIKSSPYCDKIAKGLRFSSKEDYEAAVRVTMKNDEELVNRSRQAVGPIPAGSPATHTAEIAANRENYDEAAD
ncbi:AAA family ATPase [Brevibacterium metallidurans]|uniref:AAA family ATPase n=1 Tax=Brevibacterium metallidurans TaxID=1482676 RepID=UPI0030D88C30